MAYVINRYDGRQLIVLDDGTLDTSTSLGLLGRNYTGYGEVQNENFVYLLENFSNNKPPLRPLEGQIWYNSSSKTLKLYNGTEWISSAASEVGSTPPVNSEGSFWFNSTTKQLYVFQDNAWQLVGPEAVEGFGDTKVVSAIVRDTSQQQHAVMLLKLDGIVQGVVAKNYFTISDQTPIQGFSSLVPGINVSSVNKFQGSLVGNADTATRLQTGRKINGVTFDGLADISISSTTANQLIAGNYISGSNFDGSIARSWSVDASSANVIGKVVARDSQGNFAAGTITANLQGNVSGNVTALTGTSKFNRVEASEFVGATLSGNAYSATKLQTSRNINNVPFDGTSDITIPTSANTLTGNTLNSGVVNSFLTSVGTLNSLDVAAAGVNVGEILSTYVDSDSNTSYISVANNQGLTIKVSDSSVPSGNSSLVFVSGTKAQTLGADTKSMIAPKSPSSVNLGSDGYRFDKVYSNYSYSPVINTETLNSTSVSNSLTVTSNLIVDGNLVVNGTTTTINSINVSVDDLTFTVASGTLTPELANGAGFIVDGAYASILYSATGDKWTINKPLDAGSNNISTTGLFQGTATSARYADLAENYVADQQYEPGTVLEFGGEFEVTIAEDSTTRVAGVVSTNPAYLMNSECTGERVVQLALQGRVPCKVRGIVNKGDMLVSAGSGFARKSKTPAVGSVIGKALEDFSGIEGIIEIVVGRI